MSETNIPEWALTKACAGAGRKLHHYRLLAIDHPLRASIEAHARLIERTEVPPADRRVRCAQRAVELSQPLEDAEDTCVRAIDLWVQGFAK